MYKLTRPDGFDFHSGTINYRNAIGSIIRVTDWDPPEQGPCGRGLHASRNPNDCFVGAYIPCAAFKVKGIQPIAKDSRKTRYRALKVVKEIHDLDKLFGWKYSEAINPINPLKIVPPEITDKQIQLLSDWASVRGLMEKSVLDSVGASIGSIIWVTVSSFIWQHIEIEWIPEIYLWPDLSYNSLQDSISDIVAAYISSFFPKVKKWKYTYHKKGTNPFQAGIDLWKTGLVPSFDGETWRLHGYEDAGILWSGKI